MSTYILLPTNVRVNLDRMVSYERIDVSVVIHLDDDANVVIPFDTVVKAEYMLIVLDTVVVALPVGFQDMYGDSDQPNSDPVYPDKPASYRGRTNNTFWQWDTIERAWYPVSNV